MKNDTKFSVQEVIALTQFLYLEECARFDIPNVREVHSEWRSLCVLPQKGDAYYACLRRLKKLLATHQSISL